MPTLNPTELRAGTAIVVDGSPVIVLKYEHVKTGRGGATVRVKIKNLKTGSIVEKTFRGNEKADSADVGKKKANFLYKSGNVYAFMDQKTFDQDELTEAELGDSAKWLTEGLEVDLLTYDDKAIGISLPVKLELEVVSTDPNVKGGTVTSVLKPATLSSGAIVSVPMFVKNGDKIRVNTEEGTYVERAN